MTTNPQPDNPYMAYLHERLGQTLKDAPSPLTVWLAGTLRDIADDGLEAAYVVRPEMANPAQVLHGGIAAAIMDDLVGGTVLTFSGGRYHASINLSVDYLAPARVGQTVVARSRIVRQGRRLVHAECTLHDEQGQLLARATTNLLAASDA